MAETKSPDKAGVGHKKVKRPINLRQLQEKKDAAVNWGRYAEVIGDNDGNCNIMIYGPAGSGKSVLALELAYELAQLFGKALYNSHEEKTNRTFRRRALDFLPPFNPDVKFHIAEEYDYDTVCAYIQKSKYRVIVIDSVQYAQFTAEQLKALRLRFRRRKLILIMVSFGTTVNKTRGADELLHACDVKLHVSGGKLTSHGRGLSEWVTKDLFKQSETPKHLPGQLELHNA